MNLWLSVMYRILFLLLSFFLPPGCQSLPFFCLSLLEVVLGDLVKGEPQFDSYGVGDRI